MASQQHHHHVAPVKYYVATFATLLALTILTVAVAQFDFGAMNIVIAMGVAVCKASLVLMFFMGLLWDKKINAVFFLTGLLFLGLFIGFCVLDIGYRGDTDPVESLQYGVKVPVRHAEAEH